MCSVIKNRVIVVELYYRFCMMISPLASNRVCDRTVDFFLDMITINNIITILAVLVCIKWLNFNESAPTAGNVYRVVYDAAVQL